MASFKLKNKSERCLRSGSDGRSGVAAAAACPRGARTVPTRGAARGPLATCAQRGARPAPFVNSTALSSSSRPVTSQPPAFCCLSYPRAPGNAVNSRAHDGGRRGDLGVKRLRAELTAGPGRPSVRRSGPEHVCSETGLPGAP